MRTQPRADPGGVARSTSPIATRVLEIGSGTGQHAVYFAAAMPWLTWQCSDRAEYLPASARGWTRRRWRTRRRRWNWTWRRGPWPRADDARDGRFDAAFSANTLHIMGWPEVEAFFAGLDTALADDATLVVYGPFNYGGAYTSDSNREFDGWLQARDPRSGIRDFEAVDALAQAIGLRLVDDVAMPANNRCLVWRRGDHAGFAARR